MIQCYTKERIKATVAYIFINEAGKKGRKTVYFIIFLLDGYTNGSVFIC